MNSRTRAMTVFGGFSALVVILRPVECDLAAPVAVIAVETQTPSPERWAVVELVAVAKGVRHLVQEAPGVAVPGDQPDVPDLAAAGLVEVARGAAGRDGLHDGGLSLSSLANPHDAGQQLEGRDRAALAQMREAARALKDLL